MIRASIHKGYDVLCSSAGHYSIAIKQFEVSALHKIAMAVTTYGISDAPQSEDTWHLVVAVQFRSTVWPE